MSFHDDEHGRHNLAAYDDDGKLLSGAVLSGAGLDKAELRGLGFAPDGALWVLNGSVKESAILRFTGAGTRYTETQPVASHAQINSLWHPFDFVLAPGAGGQLYCYVSNQDTNVVARLAVAADYKSAPAAPIAPALPKGGKFLDGTFVASSRGKLPKGVPETTPIPQSKGGLAVETEGTGPSEKIIHSVRGVAVSGARLYVADEPGNAIKLYNAEGRFLGQTEPIKGPVHLCVHEETYKGKRVETLYAVNGSGIFCATLPLRERSTGIFEFPSTPLIKQPGAAGLAFAPEALYVADRKQGQVYLYPEFSREAPEHICVMFDVYEYPEFVLYVAD